MANLQKNWITEKLIDFEYKKYILLAYLQEVSFEFEQKLLYPTLADLIEHYRQIVMLKENKQNLLNAFPVRLNQIDLENFRMKYERMAGDDLLMREIESILDYSLPQFEKYVSEGKKIYDHIEERLHIIPIGVMPLYPERGYLFLKDGKRKETNVFEYHITIYEQPDTKYRAIHTTYLRSYASTISHTFENIKTELIREKKELPNPAAFAVESDISLPLDATFLPIAKQILVKFVAKSC